MRCGVNLDWGRVVWTEFIGRSGICLRRRWDHVGCSARSAAILDVDETLIYGSERELGRPADLEWLISHLSPAIFGGLSGGGGGGCWRSGRRPRVTTCRRFRRRSVRRVANGSLCGGAIRGTKLHHRSLLATVDIKHLKKVKRLGYDAERILVVDDSPDTKLRQFWECDLCEAVRGSGR